MSKVAIVIDQDLKKWRDEYQQAIKDLENLPGTDLNTIAKCEQAIKRLGEIQLDTLKALKKILI